MWPSGFFLLRDEIDQHRQKVFCYKCELAGVTETMCGCVDQALKVPMACAASMEGG